MRLMKAGALILMLGFVLGACSVEDMDKAIGSAFGSFYHPRSATK